MISDVDEIPRPDIIRQIAMEQTPLVYVLKMRFFDMRLNHMLLCGRGAYQVWSAVLPRRLLGTPQDVRNKTTLINANKSPKMAMSVLENGGWHFSSVGDDEHMRTKFAAFAHQ